MSKKELTREQVIQRIQAYNQIKGFQPLFNIPQENLHSKEHKALFNSFGKYLMGSKWAEIFAEYAGITRQTIYMWNTENGKVPAWAVRLLYALEREKNISDNIK